MATIKDVAQAAQVSTAAVSPMYGSRLCPVWYR